MIFNQYFDFNYNFIFLQTNKQIIINLKFFNYETKI